jgi:anti-anti-sigma regulatory factor
VAGDSAIFLVKETGERTVVGFRDWQSSLDALYWTGANVLVFQARSELDALIAEHQCRTLAIDMTSVEPFPSAFLALLISLTKEGVRIELLNPSEIVREGLRITKLDTFFAIRD